MLTAGNKKIYENLYVCDTSSLVEASIWYKRIPGFWNFLSELGDNNKLFIPKMVSIEIKKKDDFIKNWLEKNNKIIKEIDESQQKIFNQIKDENPNFIDLNRQDPNADPWVIALAYKLSKSPRIDIEAKVVVLTEESLNEPPQNNDPNWRPKIPYVCKKYKLQWKSIKYLLDLENKTI
ncbi:DUF4411 family protein [Caldisericum sp.]|uniref:DUF4411 family protein n=1 Tax=Caldisericum sp. TaxID=2499687 RepID=UPI003D1317DD